MDDPRYIHDTEFHNPKAALRIVPIIIDQFHPSSVLDVGCGTGDFLKVFSDNGVVDITGIDGAWLNESKLVIPKEHVHILDLEQKFDLGRRYDVVVCLEVAEHLKEESAADLIESLVRHANVIIFSAAVPHQGGQNHINEQWIDYWKALFEMHHFFLHDTIRTLIWNDNEVFWWYRQNIFVCMHASLKAPEADVHTYIHPELYLAKVWQMNAYREWIEKIISGNIEVELAQAILNNAEKNRNTRHDS